MKPLLRLVQLKDTPVDKQLAWEEALLRADEGNWCLFNTGVPPAIVMGISGKKETLVCPKKMAEAPLPLIRRFSGGGCVVVDENTLFVSLICRFDALAIAPFPRPLLAWTADNLYQPLFKGIPVALRENDYTLHGKKWGGNAQAFAKERWLHHSSLLWDFCDEKMNYLLFPPKTPEYREGRSHSEFLCRLRDCWQNREMFFDGLKNQLERHFVLEEATTDELDRIVERPHRKATSCLLH